MEEGMRRTLRAVALVSLLVLVAVGCSAREKKPGGTSGAPVEKVSASSSSSESDAAGAIPLTVTVTQAAPDQFAFALSDTTIASGPVAVTLNNQGAQEHAVTLIKLAKNTTFANFRTAVAANGVDAALAGGEAASGPNAVAPGQTGVVTALLTPGDYGLVDLTRGPPDGKSGAEHGLIVELNVSQPQGALTLPDASGGTITLAPGDQPTFEMPPGFNGKGTYAVTNEGTQVYDAAFYKLADGRTQDDVVNYFSSGASGPSPVTGAGGVTALAPGATVTTELNLTAGSYVVMSFLPDTNNNLTPHYVEGMITTINIS
jgi:hypothetical protein